MRLPNLIVAVVLLAVPAVHAQEQVAADAPERLLLSVPWDGAVIAGSVAAMGLSTLIPVDRSSRWNTQLLPFDSHLEGRYSAQAANVSDILLAVDVSMPTALFLRQGLDANAGRRVVVYGEALLVSLAFDSLVKPLVSRPRPYTYSDDPALAARTQSEDAHLSFYSRHSSTTFAASVSGALLFAQSTSDTNARAAVWLVELALASATADLRTRAGMHFYSDVLVGAAVGSTVGIAVPYFHGVRSPRLGKLEWLAIVLGPLVGIALGELMPVGG